MLEPVPEVSEPPAHHKALQRRLIGERQMQKRCQIRAVAPAFAHRFTQANIARTQDARAGAPVVNDKLGGGRMAGIAQEQSIAFGRNELQMTDADARQQFDEQARSRRHAAREFDQGFTAIHARLPNDSFLHNAARVDGESARAWPRA